MRTRCPDLLEEEIVATVGKLKGGKAAGVDEIPAEALKALDGTGMEWLTSILNMAWRTGTIPPDWQTGIIIPIYKKGDRTECNNYRGITLMCEASKLYAKVLKKRLSQLIEPKLSEDQAGFRPGRSISDHIFSLRLLSEHAWEYDKPL